MNHIGPAVREVKQRGNMSEIITSAEAVSVPPPTIASAGFAITGAQIAAYRQQRAEQFNARLTALCNELECDLDAVPQIVDGRIVASIVVRPR